MDVRGRRIFNRRPVCFFALFLAAGILVAEAFYALPHLYRLIPLFVVVASCVFLATGKARRKYLYVAIAFATGFLSCSGAADIYDSRLIDDVSGTFTARVASEIIVEDGMAQFYVEDLAVDGEVLDGECVVYVAMNAPDFGAGDIVVIKGDLVASRHEAFDSYFATDALNGTYFTLWGDSAEFLAAGEPDFILEIQLAISRLFYEHTDADTSAIARALVLGDKRGIDDLLYGDIQASGLAHVLAVSGLHITTLATAVYWLLRKLRVNAKIALPVVLVLTFFYIALCGFSPSAVRAFVMTAVFNFGSAFGLKKDGLSSLAFAAAAILVFSPFSIMHVGFLLSVFSVFGIMTFAGPIKKFMMKGIDAVAPARATANISSAFTSSVAPTHGFAAIVAGSVPEPGAASSAGKSVAADIIVPTGHVLCGKRNKAHERNVNRESVLRILLSRIAEASSVALAANFTSMPFAAYFFGKVQTLFIISNIVILPYTMFIYIFLLLITPFSLITGLHGLVGAADWIMLPFTAFAHAVGGVSFASVPASISVGGIVCVLAIETVLSRFLFLRKAERVVAVLVILTLYLVGVSVALLV